MRLFRFKPNPEQRAANYHLISRVVAGEMLFGPEEKEMLRRQMWLIAERCGIQVLTYQMMTNHLHIIAHAPVRRHVSDEELLRRYELLRTGKSRWERRAVRIVREMLAADGEDAKRWRDRELRKAGDVSFFMKLLKQRYSIWYNETHDRFGTLWASRFKSVLLQAGNALRKCAAYVDRNAVRAKMCSDPATYRYGGFGEAVAGSGRARAGILRIVGAASWAAALQIYRSLILANGGSGGTGDAFSRLIEGRCRYFTDGAVMGTRVFVAQYVAELRRRTGGGEQTEPRDVPGLEGEIAVLRKLRLPA